MRSTILVRYTIHTRAVLLSIDQYMGMHQHFHNTPPQWKLQWIVNQKKRDDYVNKKQNPIFCQPEIQTNITFYAYIHQCAKYILDDSFNQWWCKAEPWLLKSNTNKTNLDLRNRKTGSHRNRETQNTNDDVDEVRSSWSSVEVVEDDACSDASFRCQRVDAPSICNV